MWQASCHPHDGAVHAGNRRENSAERLAEAAPGRRGPAPYRHLIDATGAECLPLSHPFCETHSSLCIPRQGKSLLPSALDKWVFRKEMIVKMPGKCYLQWKSWPSLLGLFGFPVWGSISSFPKGRVNTIHIIHLEEAASAPIFSPLVGTSSPWRASQGRAAEQK